MEWHQSSTKTNSTETVNGASADGAKCSSKFEPTISGWEGFLIDMTCLTWIESHKFYVKNFTTTYSFFSRLLGLVIGGG